MRSLNINEAYRTAKLEVVRNRVFDMGLEMGIFMASWAGWISESVVLRTLSSLVGGHAHASQASTSLMLRSWPVAVKGISAPSSSRN